jgi:Pyruvate/2-oxoacid:ferredoxin oxidoreductase delta subunit
VNAQPVTVISTCTACGACLPTCPERAFRIVAGGRPPLRVLPDVCTGCLECLEVCPADAIVPVDREVAP